MLDTRTFTTGNVLHVACKLSCQLFILFYMVEKRFVSVFPDVIRGLRFRLRGAILLCGFDGLRGHYSGYRSHKEGPVVQRWIFDESGGGAGMGYFSGSGFAEEICGHGHAGDRFELIERNMCC